MRLGILALALTLHGCQYAPFAHTYTTKKPNARDVVGRYVLQDQFAVPGGIDALKDRPCEVVLKDDGTFTAQNVPPWERLVEPSPTLDLLASASGPWRVEVVGSIDNGWSRKDHWGVRLGRDHPWAIAGFTGEKPPYGIVFDVDDPNLGRVILLKKVDEGSSGVNGGRRP